MTERYAATDNAAEIRMLERKRCPSMTINLEMPVLRDDLVMINTDESTQFGCDISLCRCASQCTQDGVSNHCCAWRAFVSPSSECKFGTRSVFVANIASPNQRSKKFPSDLSSPRTHILNLESCLYLTSLLCRWVTAVLLTHTIDMLFRSGSFQQSDQCLGTIPSPISTPTSRQAGGSTLPNDQSIFGAFERSSLSVVRLILSNSLPSLARQLLFNQK